MVLVQDTIVVSTLVAGVFKLAVGVWTLRVGSVIPVYISKWDDWWSWFFWRALACSLHLASHDLRGAFLVMYPGRLVATVLCQLWTTVEGVVQRL